MTIRRRVAILISGRGSNMRALVEAARDPGYPAAVACVLSNRADAEGLAFAAAQGIPAIVVPHRDFPSRDAFERALEAALSPHRPDLIALAGFMRVLTPGFTQRWHGRLVNIHPSLLPRHKGLDTHEKALAAGDAEHGCTVHFVSPGVDEGQIIAQARVPVLPGDTAAFLAARVLEAEHRLYPAALADVASGRVRLVGSEVVRTA